MDDEIQFRSTQDAGPLRRSLCQSLADNSVMEQYDTSKIEELLSAVAVGDGAGRIPLNVAELIASCNLRRL